LIQLCNIDDNDSVSVASFFVGFGSSEKDVNKKKDSKEAERSKRAWVKVQERFGNMASCVIAQEALAEVNDILENPEAGKPSFAVTTLTSQVEADDATSSSSTGIVGDSRASTDASPQVSVVKVGLRK